MKIINFKFLGKIASFLMLFLFLIITSCDNDINDVESDVIKDGDGELYSSDSTIKAGGGSGTEGQGNGNNSGLVTAGEWNDLNNWDFWTNILNENDYFKHVDYWSFYTKNRISVLLKNNNTPVINAVVELKLNNEIVWKSMTDNLGKTELFIGLYNNEIVSDLSNYKLFINNVEKSTTLKFKSDGDVEIEVGNSQNNSSNKVELAFIVDATGSMSDELEFLKDDLKDVIERVEQNNSTLDVLTGTVFYRDIDDEYLVKSSGFSGDISYTLNYINEQSASGGGDFPEAVHTALNEAINELQWSTNSKTRIAFLLLDAPPHYTPEIVDNLHNLISKSAEKGIKIIPITASGINKETEFLMRFFSVSTNGTYVFITNDSGIGNEHLEASVGEYEVENLNDLLVRLIDKYSNSASF
ncbi:vWA domain-containing protein [Lutibacter citreus]|uniref:VWA domain-containing protein n=1 Tax=Lutibacter citreus TaxID=2138210 RepID=UPI000DBE5DDF|nr:VWA domain-containing protein [Lutibacter citreus]